MLEICSISDIHGNLVNNIPICDVLCICGDIVDLNCQRVFESSAKWWKTNFVEWINKLHCSKVIITAGNHDFYIEELYNSGRYKEFKEELSKLTNNKLEILLNESYVYKGIMFYGCPYVDPIGFGKWAFESKEDELYNIPDNVDILITHDSPIHNNRLGFTKAKYHFYGHWHEGYNIANSNKYNCSILNDCYNFKNLPYVTVSVNTGLDKINIFIEFLEGLKEDANFIDEDTVTTETEYNTIIRFLDNEIANYNKYKNKLING